MNTPVFLQLSQCTTGEVDAVIPNTPEAETMTEKINVQVAAWCHFYWKDTNAGAKKFYRKLSDQAFNQILRHEISSCTWDATNKIVTSPRAVTEMATIAEFEQQDWVRQLTGVNATQSAKQQHVDPNVAFLFGDNFLVGTIHGANAKTKVTSPAVNEVVEIQDNDNDVSVLTTRTAANNQLEVTVGCRVASGSDPAIGPTAEPTQTKTVSGGSPDPASAGPAGGNAGGPNGK